MAMTDVEILKAAKALIAEPEHWCRDGLARDEKGLSIWGIAGLAQASAWCAIGALVAIEDTVSARQLLEGALPKRWEDRVADFNDHPKTTHRQIMNLYSRAIKAAEEAS